MRKKYKALVISQLFLQFVLLLAPSPAWGAAEIYIDDTFNDTGKIDLGNTTADVDTANGWVTLGLKNLANSLLLYEDSYDITLINNDAVETYSFNGMNMEIDEAKSINGGLDEPVSIAGRWGEYILLDRGSKEACWYHFDGVGLVPNGSISISALNDPRAIDVLTGTYGFALLDEKWVKWYCYDGTGMVQAPHLSFSTGAASNLISLSLENNNYATVILDKANRRIRYYSFNGTTMELDTNKSIDVSGELVQPVSISVSKNGGLYLIVDDSQVKAYNYDGSSMVYNPLLSVGGLNKPLAVSIKPGSYDYAVLSHDGIGNPFVSYYAFNGTSMVAIPGMQIAGLQEIPYANDQVLQGKAVDAGHDVAGLKLLADVEQPPGTSIAWEVTVDGINWVPVAIGEKAVFAATGSHPNYRANLHTEDNTVTPKILSVQLIDASLSVGNFQVTDIIGPEIPGNPELPTSQHVKIWAGYNVTLQVDTVGGAESVVADIRIAGKVITLSSLLGDLTPSGPPGSSLNTWIGTFYADALTPPGTLLDIDFTARKGTDFTYASYPDFAIIYGSALENHQIHLTH